VINDLASCLAGSLSFGTVLVRGSVACLALSGGIIAFSVGKVARSLAISIGVASWVSLFARFAFLGLEVAFFHSLGVFFADLFASSFIWELGFLFELASHVGPVAVISLAVLGFESSWASELVWLSLSVTTAFEFGLSSILVVQGSTLAPSAFDIIFFGCDT